jgi:hypothetical protein
VGERRGAQLPGHDGKLARAPSTPVRAPVEPTGRVGDVLASINI